MESSFAMIVLASSGVIDQSRDFFVSPVGSPIYIAEGPVRKRIRSRHKIGGDLSQGARQSWKNDSSKVNL
ncbi:MAG: hypothetical protein ACJAQT_005164 [Akkermansiaceae bacterium]|jgi:hypothetical protein